MDVAGTVEEKRKEGTPKEEIFCKSSLGHRVNNFVTVIFFKMGSYQTIKVLKDRALMPGLYQFMIKTGEMRTACET